MARYETIIRKGYIVDGTGGAAYYGDLGITAGRIVDIGNLEGSVADEVIEAAGMVVAPGYVTSHSHFDAMLFWNPYCPSSGTNGVTTVVNANCGFGFAPVRFQDRERLMMLMANTEQIPVEQQREGMSWDWETFPEWLDRIRSLPKGVNVLSYLPLTPLLTYVMGPDDVKKRRPTAAELAEMRLLIHEAMAAGALGISASLMGVAGNAGHVDYDGSRVPTDEMDIDDFIELARAVAERGDGAIQVITETTTADNRLVTECVAEALRGSGTRLIHCAFFPSDVNPALVAQDLAWLDGLRSRGLDVTAQALVARFWSESLMRHFVAGAFLIGPSAERMYSCHTDADLLALISDPEFQEQCEAEQGDQIDPLMGDKFSRQTVLDVGPNPELQGYVGHTLGEIGRDTGRSALKVMFDLAVRSNLQGHMKGGLVATKDLDQALQLMRHPGVTIATTDAGAHTKGIDLGHYGTDFLLWLVRDEKRMSREEMHHHLSLRPAQTLQIRDRGALAPGFWADIVVYDPERLFFDMDRYDIVYDMPAGDWRRGARAGGYSYILVNGVVTHVEGEVTGATPGRLVEVRSPDAEAQPVA